MHFHNPKSIAWCALRPAKIPRPIWDISLFVAGTGLDPHSLRGIFMICRYIVHIHIRCVDMKYHFLVWSRICWIYSFHDTTFPAWSPPSVGNLPLMGYISYIYTLCPYDPHCTWVIFNLIRIYFYIYIYMVCRYLIPALRENPPTWDLSRYVAGTGPLWIYCYIYIVVWWKSPDQYWLYPNMSLVPDSYAYITIYTYAIWWKPPDQYGIYLI